MNRNMISGSHNSKLIKPCEKKNIKHTPSFYKETFDLDIYALTLTMFLFLYSLFNLFCLYVSSYFLERKYIVHIPCAHSQTKLLCYAFIKFTKDFLCCFYMRLC